MESEKDEIRKILNDSDMYGDYDIAISKFIEYSKSIYNQAIEDCLINAEVKMKHETFGNMDLYPILEKESLLKLKK